MAPYPLQHLHKPSRALICGRVALGTKIDPLLEEVGKKENPESDFSFVSCPQGNGSSFPEMQHPPPLRSRVLLKREEEEELCIRCLLQSTGLCAVVLLKTTCHVEHFGATAYVIFPSMGFASFLSVSVDKAPQS